jgi:hypothetical protein
MKSYSHELPRPPELALGGVVTNVSRWPAIGPSHGHAVLPRATRAYQLDSSHGSGSGSGSKLERSDS